MSTKDPIAALYRVSINHHDADHEGHVEIEVNAGTDSAFGWEDGYYEAHLDDVHAAQQYMAGMLGRLGAWMGPFAAIEARQHGCRQLIERMDDGADFDPLVHPIQWEGCGISIPDTLLKPSDSLDVAPGVYVTVHRDRVKVWKRLIRDWLRVLREDMAGVGGPLKDALTDPNEPRIYPAEPTTGAAS